MQEGDEVSTPRGAGRVLKVVGTRARVEHDTGAINWVETKDVQLAAADVAAEDPCVERIQSDAKEAAAAKAAEEAAAAKAAEEAAEEAAAAKAAEEAAAAVAAVEVADPEAEQNAEEDAAATAKNIEARGRALCSFGFQLFSKVCEASPKESIVLSPFVVAGALSMAAAGATASSKVELELLGTLGFKSHEDFSALSKAVLASDGASVSAANGVFVRNDIRPEYVTLVASTHDALAGTLGSSYDPINKWVEQATNGKITDLLVDPVDPLTVAVLVSAVFFKGVWAAKFDSKLTERATFRALDERKLTTMMMCRTGKMRARESVPSLGGAATVCLDYGAGEGVHDFCALLVLPSDPGAASLAATVHALSSMGATAVSRTLSELSSRDVVLRLPRAKAEYGTATLKGALNALGMAECFNGSGGFRGMSDDETVHIDDVLTKALLEMDEEGTTAAAAAAVKMAKRSCATRPLPPLELTFDRPFLMAVLHVPSGSPLFIARINEPQEDRA